LIPRQCTRGQAHFDHLAAAALSQPVSTITLSPFLIFAAITAPPARANDLHVVLARSSLDRPDTVPTGSISGLTARPRYGQADDRAIGALDILADAHHPGLHPRPSSRGRAEWPLLDQDHVTSPMVA
jgi:hypothetical protein